MRLVPVVNLIRNSPEHAVAVSLDFLNPHSFECKHPPKVILLIFDLLHSFDNDLLVFLAQVRNLLLQLVHRLVILLERVIPLSLVRELIKFGVTKSF
jgi:hypothetical protein